MGDYILSTMLLLHNGVKYIRDVPFAVSSIFDLRFRILQFFTFLAGSNQMRSSYFMYFHKKCVIGFGILDDWVLFFSLLPLIIS